MDYKVQLMSFLVSFGYGVFIVFLMRLFMYYLRNKYVLIKYLLGTFLAVDLAMLYVAIMYRVNEGQLHVYFFLVMFLGMFVGNRVKLVSIMRKLWKRRCEKG